MMTLSTSVAPFFPETWTTYLKQEKTIFKKTFPFFHSKSWNKVNFRHQNIRPMIIQNMLMIFQYY